jgi:hypothetical protein
MTAAVLLLLLTVLVHVIHAAFSYQGPDEGKPEAREKKN